MSDDEKKKKKGFFKRAFGLKSKEDKLAEAAAEKAAQQQQVDDQMAARMAAINAAALKSAREQDEQASGTMVDEADKLRVEAEEKRLAEEQALKDVEAAKRLAEEKKAKEREAIAKAEAEAEAKRLAEEQAAREEAERIAAEKAAETARLKAEAEAKAKAAADSKVAAEAKVQAEKEARLKAEEEKKRKAAELAALEKARKEQGEAEAAALKAKQDSEAEARALKEAKEAAEREEAERAKAEEQARQALAAKQQEEARAAQEKAENEKAAKEQQVAAAKELENQEIARQARERQEREAKDKLAQEKEDAARQESEKASQLAEQAVAKAAIEPEASTPAETDEPVIPKQGFFNRITKGLRKSTSKMSDSMSSMFNKRKLDAEALEELEDLLIASDLGVGPAMKVTELLAKDKFDKQITDMEIKIALADVISEILTPLEKPLVLTNAKPQIMLFVGVNGSGKTTTLGKIAKRYTDQGKKVLLAAGDTFRAAAVEQLTVWGERSGAPVVSGKLGIDAAGLVFDAVKRAQDENYDILMIDTAGRLQNRTELMDELSKIVRVINKADPSAPHHCILVLDATVGQNALSQTDAFLKTAGVTGLIMTKLDGTAKGGVLVALSDKFKLPIHHIGIGERIEDLENFSAPVFAAALSGVADAVTDMG